MDEYQRRQCSCHAYPFTHRLFGGKCCGDRGVLEASSFDNEPWGRLPLPPFDEEER